MFKGKSGEHPMILHLQTHGIPQDQPLGPSILLFDPKKWNQFKGFVQGHQILRHYHQKFWCQKVRESPSALYLVKVYSVLLYILDFYSDKYCCIIYIVFPFLFLLLFFLFPTILENKYVYVPVKNHDKITCSSPSSHKLA